MARILPAVPAISVAIEPKPVQRGMRCRVRSPVIGHRELVCWGRVAYAKRGDNAPLEIGRHTHIGCRLVTERRTEIGIALSALAWS